MKLFRRCFIFRGIRKNSLKLFRLKTCIYYMYVSFYSRIRFLQRALFICC